MPLSNMEQTKFPSDAIIVQPCLDRFPTVLGSNVDISRSEEAVED